MPLTSEHWKAHTTHLSSQEGAYQGVLWEACPEEASQEGAFPDPSLGAAFQEGACDLDKERKRQEDSRGVGG